MPDPDPRFAAARSWLFVPADSERKLARALKTGADALILDLEDSVAPAAKEQARGMAASFVAEHRARLRRPLLFTRINGLAGGLAEDDLAAAVGAMSDGIVLPKSAGGADVTELGRRIAACEGRVAGHPGGTGIVAIATESGAALFGLGTYAGASERLVGLAWGAEDLSAALGAVETRDAAGRWTAPYALARSLCLAGAAAAGVVAIDTVHTDLRDAEGLAREAAEAVRDGFGAKLAIHPDQVAAINEAFTPSPQALARATAVVEAFAAATDAGVISLDGQMLDRPHLTRARRILARARSLAR